MANPTAQQLRCIDTLDRPLVVAAGAGSGKTFTLTARIVNALKTNAVSSIDEVLAITYTNKAAGELKSRIKRSLRAEGLIEESLKVDDAWISTIHAMCARILKTHALELGLDPAESVGDETLMAELRAISIEQTLEEIDPACAKRVDALYHAYGTTAVEELLEELLRMGSNLPNGLDDIEAPLKPLGPYSILTLMCDAANDYLLALEGFSNATSQKLKEATQRAVDAAQEAMSSMGEEEIRSALAHLTLQFPKPSTRVSSKNEEYRAVCADVSSEYASGIMHMRLNLGLPHLITLMNLAKEALGRYVEHKREHGVLDNADLLNLTAHAFEKHPNIAHHYAGRFKLVMLDESQDTNRMQLEMIKRLAGEGAKHLCTVGDAQQSIYRFQGADVSVFKDHQRFVEESADGEVLNLSTNFRSHSDILSFVDRIFERPDAFGGESMPLAPRDDEAVRAPLLAKSGTCQGEKIPRIELQLVTRPYRGCPSIEAYRAEAEGIAERFEALREAGYKASDMAVLLGATTNMDLFAEALRKRGFACVAVKGSVFNKAAEVIALGHVARALTNPKDSQELFLALSSDLFALNGDDLLILSTKKGKDRNPWRRSEFGQGPLVDEDLLSPGLSHALQTFNAAADSVRTQPLWMVMTNLVADSGWLARLDAQGAEGHAIAGNIMKALRLVRDIEKSPNVGPRTAANMFARTIELIRTPPGALAAEDGNFVSLMTVHSSKGLEFPIVAVANMGSTAFASALRTCQVGDTTYLSLLASTSEPSIAAAIKADSAAEKNLAKDLALNPDYDEDDLARIIGETHDAAELYSAMGIYNALGDKEERKRLLYVAITRARDAVLVSMRGIITNDNPSGLPKDVNSLVCAALFDEAPFPEGEALVDFGGVQPARTRRIDLVAKQDASEPDAEAEAGEEACEEESQDESGRYPFELTLPSLEKPSLPKEILHRSARFDVFSYSSVAKGFSGQASDALRFAIANMAPEVNDTPRFATVNAALEANDALKFAATNATLGANDALKPEAANAAPSASDAAQASTETPTAIAEDFEMAAGDRTCIKQAALAEEAIEGFLARALHELDAPDQESFDQYDDDDGWIGSISNPTSDEDKSTDLGNAFHRLAQISAVRYAKKHTETLEIPSKARIDALSRTHGLNRSQRTRLHRALERWFASSLAREAASWDFLGAEVSFFKELSTQSGSIFLEGEIDLLCMDESRSSALIVDYKTGGNSEETLQQLHAKHVAQAMTYAYILLSQGCTSVEAAFVRVEQDDTARPLACAAANECGFEPQVLRYRFAPEDLGHLEASLIAAYQATLT